MIAQIENLSKLLYFMKSYITNGKQPHVTRHDALKEAEAGKSLS